MSQWNSFVAVGDSFTEGLDDPYHDGGFRGWADLVAGRLAAVSPGFRYANLAIRGRLLAPVIAEQVPAAVEMAPDLVSFAAGGNDVLRRGYDPDRVHATLDGVVAATHRAILVDLWPDEGFRHVRMWSEDRLHLSSYGHERVASHVLEGLGVAYPPREDLPPVPRTPWLAARWGDVRWARQHLAPWIHRRLTGRSSGDTVKPKRPELAPLDSH